MFGMSFTEIIFIVIIAILFLGPDKLPTVMVEVAKFIKKIKSSIRSIQDNIDAEVDISAIKKEALNYKKELDIATDELNSFKNIEKNIKDLENDVTSSNSKK